MDSIGELVRKSETQYTKQSTQMSKYVNFSMHETIETIIAYLNSKHVSGEFDSQGREKPFFNIVIAAANIWMRATDIDRKNIKIRATKRKEWLNSFIATIKLREWMNKEKFGVYLNEWGRVLARYGSAITKVIENDSGLHISVTPWNRIICDAVNFAGNPKIEVLELTEAELYQRIDTHGYDAVQVKALCDALTDRQTLDKQRKDNKNDYIRLYEFHGNVSKKYLAKTEEEAEAWKDTYVQQMHVISFVGKKSGRKTEYDDFTLIAGQEKKDPYRIAHLIEEDGRTLAIGSVEHLFQSQWMTNHAKKNSKDTLDIASKLMFQSADASFVGRNVLTDIENGDIFIHGVGNLDPIRQVNNAKPDIQQWDTFSADWKAVGNEINGISESMLGAMPKSGTAWRQTEAILQEGYSLFEVMTENKGLFIEELIREDFIPYMKKSLDTSEEVSAVLEDAEVNRIDSIYIKSKSFQEANRKAVVEPLLRGEVPTQQGFDTALVESQAQIKESLGTLGNQRFFKPSEISDKTWKEQFKDMEWEVEVDVTGESHDVQEALTTLNTALRLVLTPGFDQNPKAQAIVGRVLELSGAMSPIEYSSIPNPTPAPQLPAQKPALPEEVTV